MVITDATTGSDAMAVTAGRGAVAVIEAMAITDAIPFDVIQYVDAVVIFVLSLLVGSIAILVGARLLVDSDAGLGNAALTALLGALAWAASSVLVGWMPLVGVVLMLVIWIGVINWRYPGGWWTAAGIGFVAWLVAVGIVYGLAAMGLVAPEALGIPAV